MPEQDFFRHPLREQINLQHPLVRLADLIHWDRLGVLMSESFVSGKGRPASSPRLIAGLLYLQHAFDLSDEEVVWQWVENPYWQVFKGDTYLQTGPPVDPSSLTRWRKRLGEAGIEELLAETIEAAKRAGVIKVASVKRVIVDTTVMAKAIAHPTDSRLLERCRQHLVRAAARHGLKLRQNYNREAPHLGASDWPLRSREAVQADEEGIAHAAFTRWADDARCGATGRPGSRIRPHSPAGADWPHEAHPGAETEGQEQALRTTRAGS